MKTNGILKGISSLMLAVASFLPANAQESVDRPAYRLYANDGKASTFQAMVDRLAQNDVIFIGEYHNSSMAHWLENIIFRAVADKLGNKLTLGMEMFEEDTQLNVNEYMAGLISEERFEAETKLWPNYKTDYAPIVESAKERGIRLVATNVPRRYARVVSSEGVDALRKFSKESQAYFADVLNRIDTISHTDNFFMMAAGMGMQGADKMPSAPKGMPAMAKGNMAQKALRLTQAQALKDAVMAHNILKNLQYPFIHINGNYHSDYWKGIITYLREQKPSLKIITVTTVYQKDLSTFDKKNQGRADYYIVLPEDTHKTF